MSGSLFASWARVRDPINYAVQLAKYFNCSIPTDLTNDHNQVNLDSADIFCNIHSGSDNYFSSPSLLPTFLLPDLLATHFCTDWLSRLGLSAREAIE